MGEGSRSKCIAGEDVHFCSKHGRGDLGKAVELCELGLKVDESLFASPLLSWFVFYASQVWKSWILREELPGVRRPLLCPTPLGFCQPHMLHGVEELIVSTHCLAGGPCMSPPQLNRELSERWREALSLCWCLVKSVRKKGWIGEPKAAESWTGGERKEGGTKEGRRGRGTV